MERWTEDIIAPKPRLTAVLRDDAMDAPASIQTPTQHSVVAVGRYGPIRASRETARRGAPHAIPPDRIFGSNATHRPGGGR